ncbi:Neuropeptide Y receptor type 2 [Acropora cervicornis]|uniref:Neuropeptide Y receptor type 2 n=1 Tax=Acropora cervicornis TaxID=6130 RepID=A0AAD9QJM6_ACRCE|nr:Neuropeptide Y receptor type 2 [Acropora cervicornis]
MTYETPLFTKIFLSAVTVIEALVGVLSNALILLLIVRFKSLQTVGNLLLANLAVVDMLNAAINMPIQLLYTLLEPRLFRGPVIAFLITFLQRVFVFLNLASMLVLLANMYFGIAFNLRYYAWKTHRKAALCCFLIWLICTSLAQLSCLPILSIDLGDSPVGRHRAEIFNQGKHQFIAVALFVLFGGIVFVVLIVCSIRRSRRKSKTGVVPENSFKLFVDEMCFS